MKSVIYVHVQNVPIGIWESDQHIFINLSHPLVQDTLAHPFHKHFPQNVSSIHQLVFYCESRLKFNPFPANK